MDALVLCMGLRTSSVIGFKNKQASCKQTNMHNQYVIQYPMLIRLKSHMYGLYEDSFQ